MVAHTVVPVPAAISDRTGLTLTHAVHDILNGLVPTEGGD